MNTVKYFEIKKIVHSLRIQAEKLNFDGRKKIVKEFNSKNNELCKITSSLQKSFLTIPCTIKESNINKQIKLTKILNKPISINKSKTSIYLKNIRVSNHWHNSSCENKFQVTEYINTGFLQGNLNSNINTTKPLIFKKNYLINKRLVVKFLAQYGA